MSRISTCLWFETAAEEAANYYVSLFPNSRIVHVQKNVADGPSGKAGSVLIVHFELVGQSYQALNGGEKMDYSYAMSLSVACVDQAEVDRLWNALSKEGKEIQCGWVKDKYGVPWQIVPTVLPRMLADEDPAKAQRVMAAMLGMVKLDIAELEKAYAG